MKAIAFSLVLTALAAIGLSGCTTETSAHGSYNDPGAPHYYPTDVENPAGTSFNPNSPGFNPGGPAETGGVGR